MIRLKELLYSLTTVIIRYHDSLVTPLIIATNKTEMHLKSRDLATTIIDDHEQDFKLRLSEIIQNCTKGYPGRRPFLNFILNEIVLLHSYLNKKNSFSAEEFIEYKTQVFKLLMDFKGLLTTIKSKTYPVTQHKTEIGPEGIIALSGCINDGYTGNEFCNSGMFLKEEVLGILNIKISFVEEKYKEFADLICTEHQNTLLIPELLARIEQIELAKCLEIEQVKQAVRENVIDELAAQKSQETQPALTDQSAEIRALEEIIQQQKTVTDELAATITDLKSQIQVKDAALIRRQLGLGYSPGLFPFLRYPTNRVDDETTQSASADEAVDTKIYEVRQ